MRYVLAILATLLLGAVVPVCGASLSMWLFRDNWNWKHTMFVAPIVLVCVNAPAYSAAATGFLTWQQAVVMQAFAVGFLGLAMLINGGNASEGYV